VGRVTPATTPTMEFTMYRQSFRGVVTALFVACLPFVLAQEARSAPLRPTTAAVVAARTNAHSWCLQYDGGTDCSFSNRAQCAATAAGGLGECVATTSGAWTRD